MPTWTGGGGPLDFNWSTAANWDTGVPTAAQPAIFDGVTGVNPNKNVTITSGATCASITFLGYTGEANFTNNLTVAGNITFGTGMSFNSAGTANLVCTSNNGILTSNSKTFPGGIVIGHTGINWTTFLADNWTILGSLSRQSTADLLRGQTTTRTLTVGGSVLFGTGLRIQDIVIKLNNTGNLSGTVTSIGGTTRIEIDTPSGAITHNAALRLNGVVFRWIQGTFTSTAALELGSAGNVLDNVGSISFSSLSFVAASGGVSATILSDVNVTNNMISNVNGYTINGLFNIFVGGSILLGSSTPFIDGTSTIVMNGAVAASIGAAGYNTTIRNNLTINKTFPATVSILSPTFTWGASGRILQKTGGNINPGTSTITIPNASVTINNMVFNNLTITGGASTTITQNVLNTINGILQLNGNATFAGTAGWTCASLVMTAAGTFTITLQNGVTYTTTTAVQLTGATNTARYTMISDNVSFRAIWTVGNTATQAITYVDGTRIDSSGGATVWTLGTVSLVAPDTRNWNNGSQPSTVGYTFVN